MSGQVWLALEPAAKASSTLATIMCVALLAGFYPRPKGLLSSVFLKDLSACLLHLFAPSLLFSTFAQATTLRPVEAAFCVTWGCVFTAINFGLGVAFAPLAQPDPAFANTFKLLITFPNAAALPLLFMTSLVRIPAIGGGQTAEVAFARSVQYIYVYGLSWTFLIWTLGLGLTKHDAAEVILKKTAAAAAMAAAAAAKTFPPSPNQPSPSPPSLSQSHAPVITFLLALKSSFMNPPVVGLLLGCAISFWESFRVALFSGGALSGVGDVLHVLGAASVPSAMIILAGSIFGGLADLVATARASQGAQLLPADTTGFLYLWESIRVLSVAARRAVGVSDDARAHVPLAEIAEENETPMSRITPSPSTAWLALAAEKHVEEERGVEAAAAVKGTAEKANAVLVRDPPTTGAPSVPVSLRTAAILFAVRLIVAPSVCFLAYAVSQTLKVPVLSSESVDKNAQLVVLVQAAMPSAQTILMLITVCGNEAAAKSAALLFVAQYPLALLTATAFIALALSIVK